MKEAVLLKIVEILHEQSNKIWPLKSLNLLHVMVAGNRASNLK